MNPAEAIRHKFPDGIVVKGSSPVVYLLEDGKKRPFADGESFYFYGFRWRQVVEVEDMLLDFIPDGAAVSREGHFVEGSPGRLLLKGSHPAIYVWENGLLTPFDSPACVNRLKYELTDLVHIPDPILEALPKGKLITEDTPIYYPLIGGRIFGAPDGRLYVSERGELRHIPDLRVFHYFKWRNEQIISLTADELSACPIGKPILAFEW